MSSEHDAYFPHHVTNSSTSNWIDQNTHTHTHIHTQAVPTTLDQTNTMLISYNVKDGTTSLPCWERAFLFKRIPMNINMIDFASRNCFFGVKTLTVRRRMVIVTCQSLINWCVDDYIASCIKIVR